MQKSNSVASFYDKYPYPNFEIKDSKDLDSLRFQEFIVQLVKTHSLGKKVLEVGTGTGELAFVLSKNNYNVTGYDISTKSIEIAKSNAKKLNLKVKFIYKDILEDVGKNDFDVCIANGVLHHTGNPLLGLTNIEKSLRTGGVVILVLYNKYGSLPRLFISKFFGALPGKLETKIKFIRSITQSRYKGKSDSVIADTFFHPYESHHSLQEVLNWHSKINLEPIDIFPPVDLISYSKLFKYILHTGNIYKSICLLYSSNHSFNPKKGLSKFKLSIYQLLWMISTRGNVFVVVSRK